MATYKELLARKQELDSQIENARRAEAASALAGIKETIAAFGFTPDFRLSSQAESRRRGPSLPQPDDWRHLELGLLGRRSSRPSLIFAY